VCHLFGAKDNQRLLVHLFQAISPEGTLAIIDSLHDGTAQREQAIYALGLLLRAPEGDVYPLSSYGEWLLQAGFEGVEDVPLTERPPLTLVTARRPGPQPGSMSTESGGGDQAQAIVRAVATQSSGRLCPSLPATR